MVFRRFLFITFSCIFNPECYELTLSLVITCTNVIKMSKSLPEGESGLGFLQWSNEWFRKRVWRFERSWAFYRCYGRASWGSWPNVQRLGTGPFGTVWPDIYQKCVVRTFGMLKISYFGNKYLRIWGYIEEHNYKYISNIYNRHKKLYQK